MQLIKKPEFVLLMFIKFLTLILFIIISVTLYGQDNYEIQVYGSETVEKGRTMIELHSNYTFAGSKTKEASVYPTDHVFHETIEITHGWTPWFETGFYIFNTIGSDGRSNYVGSHIRPRVAAPAKWKWPVGISISTEFGFQRAEYDPNTISLEIRPIIDKKWGGLYISLNPVVDKSFKGPDQHRGFIFSPNVKESYDITKAIALGFEYYGSTGPFFRYDTYQQQQHQLFLAADLTFDPKWEFNAGYGIGFTNTTDRAIFKIILGRRF
jgi:hypothetical protein